ncbi:MAG: ATP-binding protein, partial [Bulleidia sp.]|nr:ATP-binding protein [Bulleidia sp.]
LKKEHFEINAFICEQMKKYEVYRVQDGFQFEVHLDDPSEVFADRIRLAQVFNNFVINAINYGGEAKHIIITQQRKEQVIRISIQDFGPGIAEKDIDNIWDRYYKVDQQHVRSSSGSGIGLAICRQLLELHGAEYGVDSRLQQGSTFWFELPIDIHRG